MVGKVAVARETRVDRGRANGAAIMDEVGVAATLAREVRAGDTAVGQAARLAVATAVAQAARAATVEAEAVDRLAEASGRPDTTVIASIVRTAASHGGLKPTSRRGANR